MLKQADDVRPMATLRLFADDLVPEDIDRVLAHQATVAAVKGESLLRRKDGGYVPARTGTWFFTTEKEGLGLDPTEHLTWIVQLLSRHLSELRQKTPTIQADLSLLIHDKNFHISDLPSALVRQAVSAGDLEIEIPGRAIDVVLTPENVNEYFKN